MCTFHISEIALPHVVLSGSRLLIGVSRTPEVNVSGQGYAPAEFYSGNGTAHMIFLYTVQPGDHSADLEYWDDSALYTDGYIRRTTDLVCARNFVSSFSHIPHELVFIFPTFTTSVLVRREKNKDAVPPGFDYKKATYDIPSNDNNT